MKTRPGTLIFREALPPAAVGKASMAGLKRQERGEADRASNNTLMGSNAND
jgi:hypothetical protein